MLGKFKPRSLLDYWTIAAYLTAVLELFLLRGLDFRALVFFLIPPSVVFYWRNCSERASTRLLSALFLSLIGAGVSLAKIERLFPNLGGVDGGLSPAHDRILSWYMTVYILYVTFLLPLLLFGRGLLDHRNRRAPMFSKFTCVLGLIACFIVGPGMFFGACGKTLGLFPVWGFKSAAKAQQIPERDR